MTKQKHEITIIEFALNHWRAMCTCGWDSAAYGLRRTAQGAANEHEREQR